MHILVDLFLGLHFFNAIVNFLFQFLISYQNVEIKLILLMLVSYLELCCFNYLSLHYLRFLNI